MRNLDDDNAATDFGFPDLDGPVTLTPEGKRRRIAMRAALQSAVVSRRRLRAASRVAALVVVTGAAVAAFRIGAPPGTGADSDPVAVGDSSHPPPPELAHVRLETIATDESLLARYAVPTRSGIASDASVGDDELLDLLAAAGHATGLARFDDRVVLTDATSDDTAERVAIGGIRGGGS